MAKNLLKENKNLKVRLEFYRLTNIQPLYLTNKLEDLCIKKNDIFDCLAEKVFDNPRLLDLLTIKLKHWLRKEKSEFIYALAGYINYLKDDFHKAEVYFLKAININPENLDNWFPLAFSLYHQEDKKHNLGKQILFNFDYCVKFFKNKKINIKSLRNTLKNL